MKLRHHRKRRNHLGRIRAAFVRAEMVEAWYRRVEPSANRGSGSRIFVVSSARRSGKTAATLQSIVDTVTDRFADDMLDAVKYGFSAIRWDFAQGYEAPPVTEVEAMARKIVQDAELFDRTLDHYVRPGQLEAIPAQHHMATSRRYYEQRMREACERYGTEVRTAARRYSTSPEYRQWLRENPPEVRR